MADPELEKSKMKVKLRRCRSQARAFTLLEVLMVVIIIGLLAAMVVPNLWGTQEQQKIKLTKATVTTGFNNALELFRANMGRYPTTEEGLIAMYESPDDDEEAQKWVQTIKKAADLIDVWGHEYIYECPGKYNENGYDLSSMGPDGEQGTDDDIQNWEET